MYYKIPSNTGAILELTVPVFVLQLGDQLSLLLIGIKVEAQI